MNQTIVIIGGYSSWWPTYLGPARDLSDLTGLPAVCVRLWPWHWWSANRRQDATQLLAKLAKTVADARRRYGADQVNLVGHSAGGLLARLYVSDQPVWGRTYAGLEHVSTIITLGTPHRTLDTAGNGWYLTDTANRLAPAATCAPRIAYQAVAGRFMKGDPHGTRLQRRAHRAYQYFAGRGDVWGDGVVPVDNARLAGAQQVILDGIAHGRRTSADWYAGSREILGRWWPAGDGRGT
jgi:pimeloyl-ACP methyl ester carboxylesterase